RSTFSKRARGETSTGSRTSAPITAKSGNCWSRRSPRLPATPVISTVGFEGMLFGRSWGRNGLGWAVAGSGGRRRWMQVRSARRRYGQRTAGGTRTKIRFVEIGMDGVKHGFVGGVQVLLVNRGDHFTLYLRQGERVTALEAVKLEASRLRFQPGDLARL